MLIGGGASDGGLDHVVSVAYHKYAAYSELEWQTARRWDILEFSYSEVEHRDRTAFYRTFVEDSHMFTGAEFAEWAARREW